MYVTQDKNCHCFTCDKDFHYLGINSHRAMHRRKKEDCKIKYTYGNIITFKFSDEMEEWKDMDTAPKNSSEFEGLDRHGDSYVVHYACDLSGEDQPPFEGYFTWVGDDDGGYYAERKIVKWRPISNKKQK